MSHNWDGAGNRPEDCRPERKFRYSNSEVVETRSNRQTYESRSVVSRQNRPLLGVPERRVSYVSVKGGNRDFWVGISAGLNRSRVRFAHGGADRTLVGRGKPSAVCRRRFSATPQYADVLAATKIVDERYCCRLSKKLPQQGKPLVHVGANETRERFVRQHELQHDADFGVEVVELIDPLDHQSPLT